VDVTPCEQAAAAIAGYEPADPGQSALRDRFVALCRREPDALVRTCRPGHLTASAVVVSADGARVLLHHHRKLDQWLQLGGHCDGDGDLAAVALREATEECGMAGLQVDRRIVDLDVHRVAPPAEDPHDHWDVRYVVRAPSGAAPVVSAESHDVRWFRWDDCAQVVRDPKLLALLARLARGVS
jgi:8-oxo-dGTP pyrophosphatase MutT (NUDIX family)